MLYLLTDSDVYSNILLIFALILVLIYEIINAFHDTANSIATIIYTRALQTYLVVIMSSFFNFLGVMLGGLSVAYTVFHLLPSYFYSQTSFSNKLAMVFSILFSSIVWNLGTWYFGLPISSSHTLISSMIGVGLTSAFINGFPVDKVLHVSKIINVFLSLVFSPLIGFLVSGMIIFFFCCCCKNSGQKSKIYLSSFEKEKENREIKPPFWVRVSLVFSAMGISFSHGSNDGQKGIGLIMLILVGMIPEKFILNMNANHKDMVHTCNAITQLQCFYENNSKIIDEVNFSSDQTFHQKLNSEKKSFETVLKEASCILKNLDNYSSLTLSQRKKVRILLVSVSNIIVEIMRIPEMSVSEIRFLEELKKDILNTVEYAPWWTIFSVAVTMSLGTIIGWKRIAITIGEKIGKKRMTYVQGVTAQFTTAVFVGAASYSGILVSTTQILSSSISGTMIAGKSGVQTKTIKNIILIWLLTFPIVVALSSMFYRMFLVIL